MRIGAVKTIAEIPDNAVFRVPPKHMGGLAWYEELWMKDASRPNGVKNVTLVDGKFVEREVVCSRTCEPVTSMQYNLPVVLVALRN
ncbi:MAG: hypothetical protein UY41_C0011G0008 [Candidatus Moranbacteria bacterium GW2011_GWE1_49_15]|nr:MAG: hypothetical protein UX75_C0030G0008 [Candidatus Moranbacteria bacterium GW2011_GWE2_47_10]KKW06951.1 MAG: hypothetical protein UY41_C0011G0008 [Candidatus Moranbacteria bacterium GW2011_GWE1_49_15]HBP01406.1 hypothetical protein [Candidatus Moranbacteria bacterium]